MLAPLVLAALLLAPPSPPSPPAPPRPPALRGLEEKLVGDWPAKPSGKTVSLSDKLTVDKALRRVADAAGWSLVANTGRAGDRVLVLDMREVPVEEALRAVLEGTPLAASRRGGSVTVAPNLALPGETPVLTGFDVPSGKKVTADFADAPVGKALRQIADAAGWSLVLPPGLGGTVNAQFKSTPVEDALKAVLAQASLSAVREGGIVNVSREFGPRVVVRGGKRQFVYNYQGDALPAPSQEDVERIKDEARSAVEEARAAAEEAAADAQDEVAGPGVTPKGFVKSGNVTVGPGERRRDVVALRGNVRMQAGSAARQVTAILGSVELEPGVSVDREVVAIGGDVHVAPGAHVGRDAVSIGGQVIIDPGGAVDGEEVSIGIPGLLGVVGLLGGGSPAAPDVQRVSPLLKVGHVLAKYVVLFVLGLLVLVLAPARLDTVAGALARQPAKIVLAGLLGTLAMPVLTLLLVVTVVGIPLVAVQVVAVLLAGIVGFAALALLVGRAIPLHPRRAAAVIQLALGTALVVLVTEIPVVGAMAWVTGWLFVFGAVLRTRFGQPQPGAPLATTVPPPAPPPAVA
jgi:hypothetical protein